MIYEDLGKPELADADRRKIIELGFEFERLMAALPSDQASPQLMQMGLMYLDTRGFVFGRQPWKTNTTSAEPSLIGNSTSTYYKSIEFARSRTVRGFLYLLRVFRSLSGCH